MKKYILHRTTSYIGPKWFTKKEFLFKSKRVYSDI